jgi:hypothetical protein
MKKGLVGWEGPTWTVMVMSSRLVDVRNSMFDTCGEITYAGLWSRAHRIFDDVSARPERNRFRFTDMLVDVTSDSGVNMNAEYLRNVRTCDIVSSFLFDPGKLPTNDN